MDYLPSDIEIKLIEDEKWKAIVALRFGKMVIRGFRIRVSEVSNELWVVPPSIQNQKTRKYHPIFFLEDKEQWNQIQQMILDKFDEALSIDS
ncbi:MAG: hypothetical protein HW405_588 [Candidatus Berkelbacteria bacterium]|nr:hypothetical protein [Candidatus Berkelbacteria bacterium]